SGLVEGTRLRRRRVPPLSKGCWLSRWQGRLGLDADHPCQSQAAGARRNSEICDWYKRRLAKLIAFFEATSQVGKRLEDSSASPIAQSRIKPRRVALATASVRLTTSSLRKMVFTCAFTVPSPMNSSALISLLALPAAIFCSTSISRALKAAPLTRSASFAARIDGIEVSPIWTL